MTPKIDNKNLPAKLELRRHFLRRYHADGSARVLDCCRGGGMIWSRLRREFKLKSYWGVDQKPRSGRMQIDSARILDQPGWREDVIDVDTYGSPWKHWLALLRNISQPTTVFLTDGATNITPISSEMLSMIGIDRLRLPTGLRVKIKYLLIHALLWSGDRAGVTFDEVAESESGSKVRYIGLRIRPAAAISGTPAAAPTSEPADRTPKTAEKSGRRRRRQP